MNIAVPALVILLALLPGIAAFFGYFAGKFERRHAGVTGAEELALYVFLAIPLDAVALIVTRAVGIDLNFATAAILLSGSNNDNAISEIVSEFRQFTTLSSVVYTLVLVGCYTLGALVRRFVWAFRLDTRIPLLRMKHDWFYLLQARQKGLPRGSVVAFVDVLTKHPDAAEGSRLYRGIVKEFEFSAPGKIDWISLAMARRGSGRSPQPFKWKRIPSERFVIMGSSIHSINVRHLLVKNMPPEGPQLTLYRLRGWARSFLFEEP